MNGIVRRKLEKNRRSLIPIMALITLFLLAGCAHLGKADKPRVNIANITPKEVKLFEQVFDLELRVMNPSDKGLAINGLVFDLEVNGQPFASGVSNHRFTIEPFSSYVLQVEAVTTLGNMLRQVIKAQREEFSGLTYRLKGSFHSETATFKIPFDGTGEFKRSP
jgi:LEA14-like dessication related protein